MPYCILPSMTSRRDDCFPLGFPSLQRTRRMPLSLPFPDWVTQVSSESPCRMCLPALLSTLLWKLTSTLSSLLFYRVQNCTHSIQGEAAPVLTVVGNSPLLTNGCAVFNVSQNVVCPLAAWAHSWLMVSLPVTSTHRSLSAELLFLPLISVCLWHNPILGAELSIFLHWTSFCCWLISVPIYLDPSSEPLVIPGSQYCLPV